jgi:hypothetical protein
MYGRCIEFSGQVQELAMTFGAAADHKDIGYARHTIFPDLSHGLSEAKKSPQQVRASVVLSGSVSRTYQRPEQPAHAYAATAIRDVANAAIPDTQ